MKSVLLCTALVLLLSGCPGGWRTVMISLNSATPPSPGITEYQYHPGLLASGVTLDNALLLQLDSTNPHDLGDKQPVDAPYHISGYVSAKTDDISIDLSSFVLDNLEGSAPLKPEVSLAPKRVNVKFPIEGERTVCDFGADVLVAKIGVIPVPKYDGSDWPPKNIDHSILCVLLDFKVSIREVSPDKRFQLHFRYFIHNTPKQATLYFYPIKYRYFQS